mmetsp:Transcript_17575/g.28443  ORF Transcript_17575/g.28443 Transcript_17575/m.28443 type:complete len:167 (+) Transcript_17575:360-860(+)
MFGKLFEKAPKNRQLTWHFHFVSFLGALVPPYCLHRWGQRLNKKHAGYIEKLEKQTEESVQSFDFENPVQHEELSVLGDTEHKLEVFQLAVAKKFFEMERRIKSTESLVKNQKTRESLRRVFHLAEQVETDRKKQEEALIAENQAKALIAAEEKHKSSRRGWLGLF